MPLSPQINSEADAFVDREASLERRVRGDRKDERDAVPPCTCLRILDLTTGPADNLQPAELEDGHHGQHSTVVAMGTMHMGTMNHGAV